MALAYGYQLYARTPITRPEVRIGGWQMSGIAAWGDLHTTTRMTGDWQASWSMIRDPRKQLQRHPSLVYGADVEVMYGPEPVWVGSLAEPNWDSGELVALGAPRQAETALCFTAAGLTTTKPNTAIDQAIARGAWDVTRGSDFGTTPVGEGDDAGIQTSVARLLDAWAADEDQAPINGWRVDRRRVLHAITADSTNPDWHITPGSGEMGAADDERLDRVFVRYLNSSTSLLATASYPATTPAGGVERGADITNRGAITATKAGKIAQGIWNKMNGQSGWTNGLTVNRSQVTTPGGIAANLALIKAGDAMRLLDVTDPRGLAHHIDVVIGDTDYDWSAGTIQLNPVGLAARTFEAVLEELSPGAVAL